MIPLEGKLPVPDEVISIESNTMFGGNAKTVITIQKKIKISSFKLPRNIMFQKLFCLVLVFPPGQVQIWILLLKVSHINYFLSSMVKSFWSL